VEVAERKLLGFADGVFFAAQAEGTLKIETIGNAGNLHRSAGQKNRTEGGNPCAKC
jgi:hypothetical protein